MMMDDDVQVNQVIDVHSSEEDDDEEDGAPKEDDNSELGE